MKAELLYSGFENAISKARNLGKLTSHEEGIVIAFAYAFADPARIGKPLACGYIGVNTRHALFWPGKFGVVCIHESAEGVLELDITREYVDALDKAGFEVGEYTRFLLNLMAAGLPVVTTMGMLDASLGDSTLLEMQLRPAIENVYKPVFTITEAQLELTSVGDPALRRRVDEELAGAIGSFYNDPSQEIKIHIWNVLGGLIEEDRRFNPLTRLQKYQDMKAGLVDSTGISEILAWIIDFAYSQAIAVPMWDAIIAPVGVEYIPLPDASIKTMGIMSQIGKLVRDDPTLTEKVMGITATLAMDNRYDAFMLSHPGTALWQAMYTRVKRMDGEDAANARLSWPLYQLALQYSLKEGIVK